jgi:hypothetical protein
VGPPTEGTGKDGRRMSAGVGLGALTWAHLMNDGYKSYPPAVLPLLLTKLDINLALVGGLVLALAFALPARGN